MFTQLALFDNKVQNKTYIHPHEKPYDWNTEKEWEKVGFQVDWMFKARPIARMCIGSRTVKLYSFDHVNLIPKVETRLYNLRLQWLDNYTV